MALFAAAAASNGVIHARAIDPYAADQRFSVMYLIAAAALGVWPHDAEPRRAAEGAADQMGRAPRPLFNLLGLPLAPAEWQRLRAVAVEKFSPVKVAARGRRSSVRRVGSELRRRRRRLRAAVDVPDRRAPPLEPDGRLASERGVHAGARHQHDARARWPRRPQPLAPLRLFGRRRRRARSAASASRSSASRNAPTPTARRRSLAPAPSRATSAEVAALRFLRL